MRSFKDLNVAYKPEDGKKRFPGVGVSIRELVNLPIVVKDFETGIKTEQGDVYKRQSRAFLRCAARRSCLRRWRCSGNPRRTRRRCLQIIVPNLPFAVKKWFPGVYSVSYIYT